MKNFVTKEWLRDNMSMEDLVILDARAEILDSEYGLREYKKSHIPGAQFVSLDKTLKGEIKTHGGRHPFPHMDTFIQDMRNLGIGDRSTVVVYDDGDLDVSGRVWFLLKYAGKEDVFILSGGFKEWKDSNYETTEEVKEPEKQGNLSLKIDHSLVVKMEDVRDALEDDQAVIVDSRSYERYAGEVEPLDKIAGHIPGGVNSPWMNLVEDGHLKKDEELQEIFKDIKKHDKIIVHCGSGVTGTVNLLAMERIGLKPLFYTGGYSDWISYDENEVRQK